MLKGHSNGTMLGKTFASRPSPCPLQGRVRAKAAPQVASHFGTTLVHDLVFNGMHTCNEILMLERGVEKTWMYVPWLAKFTCLQEKVLSTCQSLYILALNGAIS